MLDKWCTYLAAVKIEASLRFEDFCVEVPVAVEDGHHEYQSGAQSYEVEQNRRYADKQDENFLVLVLVTREDQRWLYFGLAHIWYEGEF